MGELRKEYNLQKERRNRFIKSLIEESIVNVLAEQEVAQQQVQAQTEPPPVATPENQAGEQPEADPVPKQYTVDNMIDELNAIRGGHSFSDPEVYGRLVTFFKNLDDTQKQNLDTLLSQIAELVTGVDDEHEQQQQQQDQSQAPQPTQPSPEGAPQQSAPMPGAQPAAGAAGVGVA